MRSDNSPAVYPSLTDRTAPRWAQSWWQAWAVWPLQRMVRLRADRRAGHRALRHARVAANRIFAVEHSQVPLLHLVDLARRELRGDLSPGPALLDSLALASIAAQRTLGLRAHLAQMAAAVLALQDRAAELACGEGKTLALALAAAVRALCGVPVHLVVRDDAVAQGAAQQMKPFFSALGLTVATVGAESNDAQRREAYQADVCYVTARELILDDLRCRWAPTPIGFRSPERACALVDDIDIVLIDRADEPYRLTTDEGDARSATVRQFFNRYPRLGGVSATLVEARGEMAACYGLGVSVIASIYPCFRRELGLTVHAGTTAWRDAVVRRVIKTVGTRRPVLVVTANEAASKLLAVALQEKGVDAIVAADADPASRAWIREAAGRMRAVTICSDPHRDCEAIALEPIARAAGGVAVVATFVAPNRRAQRRLAHFTGRQAQPGTVETIVPCAVPGAFAALPEPMMRSWVLACSYFDERRAEIRRARLARRMMVCPDGGSLQAQTRHGPLQHEG